MANETENVPVKKETSPGRSFFESPSTALASLREEIDELFDDFSSGRALAPFRRRRAIPRPVSAFPTAWSGRTPAIDVIEKDNAIEIRADLPGMEEKDIDVRMTDGALTISGETKEEQEKHEEGEYYVSERRYGSFRRTIPLPEGVDRDKVEAKFKNGLLTVELPKTPEAQQKSKKIEVKAEK